VNQAAHALPFGPSFVITESVSHWFFVLSSFILGGAEPEPLRPLATKLGFFEVPMTILDEPA
jgi:hypothetical protein